MITTIVQILKRVYSNRNKLFKAILSLSVALLLFCNISLHNSNKKLSESLEIAQNNIEAYLESFNGSLLALNVLLLSVEELLNSNDSLLQKLNETMKDLKIKSNLVSTAATQTQSIFVNKSKGVKGDLLVKDIIYNDSIRYNDLTTVYYTIGNDTVSIGLDIRNTQYLYVYTKKEYKNKKSFLKRLFTLDFKKVKKYKYEIKNTNDLINSKDVRVVELKQ